MPRDQIRAEELAIELMEKIKECFVLGPERLKDHPEGTRDDLTKFSNPQFCQMMLRNCELILEVLDYYKRKGQPFPNKAPIIEEGKSLKQEQKQSSTEPVEVENEELVEDKKEAIRVCQRPPWRTQPLRFSQIKPPWLTKRFKSNF